MKTTDVPLLEGQIPPLGAHLVTSRGVYSHHGIHVGDGRVVHYAGLADGLRAGPVEETNLATFCGGKRSWVRQHAAPKFAPAEVVERARSRLSENGYCVLANNCEHFALWAIYGVHKSKQVDRGVVASTATLGTGAAMSARAAVSAAGVVNGLSGPGIMSGLRSASLVGGGAVGGLVNGPALAGTGAALLLNATALRDRPGLSAEERRARRVGRIASHTASLAAVAGSVGVVSASGAVAGLSATGIASGLAAVGGAVTLGAGGMAAGAAVVMAAPAAAALGLGYGAYKLAQKFWR